MSKKIEVRQFVRETLQNFGRIDFLGVQYKDEMVFRNLKQTRKQLTAAQFIKSCIMFLIKSETFDTAETIVTQRQNVILILHSL